MNGKYFIVLIIILLIISLFGYLSQCVNNPSSPPVIREQSSLSKMDWPIFGGAQNLSRHSETSPDTDPVLLWSFNCPKGLSAPVSVDKRIIACGGDGNIYIFDIKKGSLIDRIETIDAPIDAPPLVIGNIIIAGNIDGDLFAVDLEKKSIKWNYELFTQRWTIL